MKKNNSNAIETASNETVKNLLTCAWCSSILEKPVIIPCCSETVCGKHETEFRKTNFECKLCKNSNQLEASKHFPANRIVQGLLDSKVTELDLGDYHKKAAESVKELSQFVDQFEQVITNAEGTVYEFFAKQRNKVDLTREELVQNLIARCSDELLKELDVYEKECRSNLPNHEDRRESLFLKNCLLDSDLRLTKTKITNWET
jgi:hypothetical protein